MMVHYKIGVEQPNQQYIQFEANFPVSGEKTTIYLPVWRPGRYELGNFAKNVRHFQIFGADNQPLTFKKTHKAVWEVETVGQTSIRVVYQYYASELNGGSTFLSKDQLYVNPVNCFVFTDETKDIAIEVELKIPADYEIACNLPSENNILLADSFEILADSPFIASPSLAHETYEVSGTTFHLWFQGLTKIDWTRLKTDFTAFTEKQMEKFTEFPVKDYHFLFQITPYKAYHGVEHHASTVILLGPSYSVFGDFYSELLGVSSHELYHTWNVKAIRPIEMFPYNFKEENFSELGYICEGVTTYMGDLFLLKSGVFNFEEYKLEFNGQLQKHFDNQGRFNYSVAESSFDTWLDGYMPGAPGRKVSIYTEGCLLAFVTDVRIRRATTNKYGLDELMKRLYFDYALANKGVSEEDYKAELKNLTGEDWSELFQDYFHGTKAYEVILADALEYLGMEIQHEASSKYSEAHLGIKTSLNHTNFIIQAIYPGSTADMGGLMLEDEIIAVNGYACQGELDKWLRMHDEDQKVLLIQRKGKVMQITLPQLNRTFFNVYSIQALENPTHHQQKALDAWKK
ncbi:MAG: PDZ domain-containing protein [Crocinitomicaceae bacterium]